MDLLPIALHAKRGNWQRFTSRKTNKIFLTVRDKVLARDAYTCRYCGFQSHHFQEVINIDQDYGNNHLNNLATACSLCMQCFFLDSIGLDGKSGGTIIYLPEISQADLNHFCRALFCSMLRETSYKGTLQAAYLSLSDRAKPVEEVFGPHTNEPLVFGQTLIDSDLSEAQQQHPIFSELKLLPAKKYFKSQAEYWKTSVFANIPL